MRLTVALLAAAAVSQVEAAANYGFRGEASWVPMLSDRAGGALEGISERQAQAQFPKPALSAGPGLANNIVVDRNGDIYQSTKGHEIIKYSGGSMSIFAGTSLQGVHRKCAEGKYLQNGDDAVAATAVADRYSFKKDWTGSNSVVASQAGTTCHRLASHFNDPRGMVFDSTGSALLVADNSCIRKIDMVTGQVTLYAGSSEGTALAANVPTTSSVSSFLYNRVQDIAMDSLGNLIVLDIGVGPSGSADKAFISKIAPGGTVTILVAQNLGIATGVTNLARSLTVFGGGASGLTDKDSILWSDRDGANGGVIKLRRDVGGTVSTATIAGDATTKSSKCDSAIGLGAASKLDDVRGLAIDRSNRAWFVSTSGTTPTSTATLAFVDLNTNYNAFRLAADAALNTISQTSFQVHQAIGCKVHGGTGVKGTNGPAWKTVHGQNTDIGNLQIVEDLAFDADGNILLLESYATDTSYIRKLTGMGIPEAGGVCHSSICPE